LSYNNCKFQPDVFPNFIIHDPISKTASTNAASRCFIKLKSYK